MTPQLAYALRRVGTMIVLAVLGVLGTEYSGLIAAVGANEAIWGGIVAAVLASAARAVEGYRDGIRAKKGDVIKEDVKPLPVTTAESRYDLLLG